MTAFERKERYDNRKKKKVCVSCGAKDKRTKSGFVHCERCHIRQIVKWNGGVVGESTLEKMRESMQARYWRLKKEKRCTDCGAQDERTLNGKIYCETCATKRNSEQKRQRRVGWV